MQSGFSPHDELARLFRQCYGLPEFKPATDKEDWQRATADFHKALKAYAPLWGWVPLDRFDKLKKENKRLEAQIADQARLIQQLEALLESEDLGHMSLLTRFQNLDADQSQAFDDLMQAMKTSSDTSDNAEIE